MYEVQLSKHIITIKTTKFLLL